MKIYALGNKVLYIKQNGKKQRMQYFSVKNFLQIKDPQILGYVSLKKKKEKTGYEAIFQDIHFPIYKDKTPKNIKGYFAVEDNQFLAIEGRAKYPWLILLFVIILTLGYLALIAHPKQTWKPEIDRQINQSSVVNEPQQDAKGITVQGFSKWHIPANKAENIPAFLENPSSNACYFTFTISLKDTNDIIYESKQVPPGAGIYEINFNRSFPKGEFPITVLITTNSVENGATMNSAQIDAILVAE